MLAFLDMKNFYIIAANQRTTADAPVFRSCLQDKKRSEFKKKKTPCAGSGRKNNNG
jgi:hypothetical protein